MENVDVVIGGVSMLHDLHCLVNAVTISPLTKKQYLIDIVGADGTKDLTEWFGNPRFESQTMMIYVESAAETSRECTDRLNNLWTGQSVQIALSFEPGFYRVGTVTQIAPTESAEIVIVVYCEPCRYRDSETVYEMVASEAEIYHTWKNSGTLDVYPELIVADLDVTITRDAAKYVLTAGTYLLPELSIPGGSEITVGVSGGVLQARYREAVR